MNKTVLTFGTKKKIQREYIMATAQVSIPITICGGFQKIKTTDQFFRKQTLEKGQSIVNAGHVGNVEERRANGKINITGSVAHSTAVREAPYKVDFEINQDRIITESRCSCVAGASGNCKHSSALFVFVNTERSTGCTDTTQVWNVPFQRGRKSVGWGQRDVGRSRATRARERA